MQNKLFKNRLIADAMISLILFSFAVSISIMFISIAPAKFLGAVYATSGVPVSNAMVIASGPNGYGFATTNPSGQYSITEGLPTGTYTVRVIAQGYLSAKNESVEVVAGQETSGINFYLTLSGGISGRVTDAVSAAPLQNIMITAFPSSGGGEFGWTAKTDANGYYSIITNLDTGTYNVTAIFPEGYNMKTMGGIAVTAGSEVKEINLALERSGIISGRVTATPSGAPLGNATVYAASDGGEYFGYAQTNATGYYRISSGLGTGTYMVTAIYQGMNIGYAMDINVVAGTETKNVDITITVTPPPPSGIITGKVTDTSDEPIVDALVVADGPAGHGEAQTDENGNYVISTGLETGTYTVSASAPGYSDEQITGVSVTINQVTSNINFQLTQIPPAQSGRITGTIQGDLNAIPEFPNTITILLAIIPPTVLTMKLLKTKTKHYHQPQ
jgi:hypothetical protein